MLIGVAQDIGVRSAGQIQPLHDAKSRKQLKSAEDRGPADGDPLPPTALQQIRGGEVAVGGRN